MEKGFPFLIFICVFNYPVESTQESCENLTRRFYKEKKLTALLQLGEGKSASVKFLEMWQTKGKSLMVRETPTGSL